MHASVARGSDIPRTSRAARQEPSWATGLARSDRSLPQSIPRSAKKWAEIDPTAPASYRRRAIDPVDSRQARPAADLRPVRPRLRHGPELPELRIPVVDNRPRTQLPERPQMPPQRRSQVLRRQIRIPVRAARRLLHQLVDDAELEGVSGGQLQSF